MAQVPYLPVPDQGAPATPLPSRSVNSPVAAFGGAVGEAIGHLGNALEGAGNELFARAYALQQLNNETEAREADAKYMMQAGELHANYNALEGKARVDAFPSYSQNLQSLRTKIRDGLSNQMAQKMYDASSLSTMGRSIFNGAGAAATANREWNEATLKGSRDAAIKTIEDNPNDGMGFDAKLVDIKRTVEAQMSLKGLEADNPATKNAVSIEVSRAAKSRVISMARTQPFAATKLYEDYRAKGLFYGEDANVAEAKVQSYAQTVGVATIADSVLSKHKTADGYDKSFEALQDEVAKEAERVYPNMPTIGLAAKSALDKNYNQLRWAEKQDEAQRKQELSDFIVKGVNDVQMLPQNLQQRMTPNEVKAFPAQAEAYRRAAATKTNDGIYHQLLGEYNNDNAKFMDRDIYKVEGINKSNIDFFLGLQRKAAANGDPRVDKAMKQLRGAVPQVLDDLGVTGPRKDQETANQFVGALHDAIQSWQETNGKPPSEKELRETIFPSVTNQIVQPGRFWGTNKVELFRGDVPQPIIDQALAAKKAEGKGEELTPVEQAQLRSQYLQAQFKKLYAGSKPSKTQDRVGQ